ncbi:MAG: peptide MFS transporter [Bacteroidia bacterium]|jgi:POT family proton-dependent oligopeptide transporter|nr:peptide MFS transporter [Bacteroidia bacterium]
MTDSTSKGHPKGLYLLFATEMWERFSYYGMRALLVLFLTKALLYDKSFASDEIYGSYTGLVYLTPLLGGYIADRYWGNRRSIIIGGILMAIGQLFMFISGSIYESMDSARLMMFVGLGFLIFGNGFFKPNISTMVGQLYPQGDKRIDGAFTIFYMGINLGAFIAPLLCGYVGDTGSPADFKWGFLAACAGMILSVILFIMYKDKLLVTPDGKPVGAAPAKAGKAETAAIDTPQEVASGFGMNQILIWLGVAAGLFVIFKFVAGLDLIGSGIFSLAIAIPGLIISDKALNKIEKQRIWVIYIAAFFVIFFWAAFEQAGASLTFFAEEQTDRTLFGWKIPASYFQSVNAVAVVIFAPMFASLWLALNRRGKEPASPYKQAWGLLLLALGYVVIGIGVKLIAPGEKSNMMWLILLYVIHTFGELCLSPIGLSMVNKLAPLKFASLLMGVWFLANAAANKFAGTLSGLYPEDVKLVATIEAKEFPYTFMPAHDSIPEQKLNIKNDSAYVVNTFIEPTEYLKEAFELKPPASAGQDSVYALKPGYFTWVLDTVTTKDEKGENKIVLKGLKNSFASNDFSLPKYKFMQIVKNYSETKALSENAAEQKKIDEAWTSGADERKAVYTFTAGGKQLAVWKAGKIELWTITPEKPKFMGFEITGLYEFFMLFVVMSGIASLILFVLAGRMVKMMHGVR